ncbi:hypothetical protein GOP47_0024753 [Adiantum capillus-veneris]|uniref:J domain-containing protein n=1 Tax=Adiantum capillus-veneris TaxID=13818 RepID=A0A9D4U3K8_ADICA|nr:hypothetical protein GOP47_0024753 [Adiantum capillus-veneris]
MNGIVGISSTCACPWGARRSWAQLKWARRRRVAAVRASSQQSPYDILGVPSTATERDIKRAYRKLALKFHPDVNKAPDAQEKFLSIKNAYQVLVDKKSRSQYDSRKYASSYENKNAWDFSARQQEDFYGLGDFFRDLEADFQKKVSTGKPKSLWEELAEIGEEFVEFLEKELNIEDGAEETKPKYKQDPFPTDDSRKSSSAAQETVTAEEEIEDILAKLKNEMGLQ